MIFGYTIADASDQNAFCETVGFIKHTLCFVPAGEVIEDVDGSLRQSFIRDADRITLESDTQIDYVAILSNIPLPIKCLHKWTRT